MPFTLHVLPIKKKVKHNYHILNFCVCLQSFRREFAFLFQFSLYPYFNTFLFYTLFIYTERHLIILQKFKSNLKSFFFTALQYDIFKKKVPLWRQNRRHHWSRYIHILSRQSNDSGPLCRC